MMSYPDSHPSKDFTLVLYSKLTGPIEEATVDESTIPAKPESTEVAKAISSKAVVDDPFFNPVPKENNQPKLSLESLDTLMLTAKSVFEVLLGLVDRPALAWSAASSFSEWPSLLDQLSHLPLF
uniref:Uncharacterized protein n=1 Tax=Strombidium inclinatum TaxID=197538 RepID=A0A7S3IV29_9SPIT|mmetsp:Transcript_39660/g.60749  ORF Transcript_39660/g.60749 Transcript_39660/m.60749 type:complete len:124 (+) Transcript_39660:1386-1757(+)